MEVNTRKSRKIKKGTKTVIMSRDVKKMLYLTKHNNHGRKK